MSYYHGLLSAPDCRNCPLQRQVKVFPDGPVPARLAFVAESPGREEERQGKGLVGPTGQLTWQICTMIGLDRSDVWCSNAILCSPRRIKLPNGAEIPLPLAQQMAASACRIRLLRELQIVSPIVIVPMGNWALWALSDIPRAKIMNYRGAVMPFNVADMAERISSGLSRAPLRQLRGKDE